MKKPPGVTVVVLAMLGMAAATGAPAALAATPAAPTATTATTATTARPQLVVHIDGVATGRLRVTGHGVTRMVRTSGTVRLAAGKYRVRAMPVNRSDIRYLPTPRNTRLRVSKGRSVVLQVAYSPASVASGSGMVADPPPSGTLGDVFRLLNIARSSGVRCGSTWMPAAPELTYDDDLALAATRHAQDMAVEDYFSHTSLDGRSFVDRIQATAYAGDPGGENIASGFQSAQAVTQGWLDSPGHCRNLMNPQFDHVGLGLASRDDARYSVPVTYWVQNFGYSSRS